MKFKITNTENVNKLINKIHGETLRGMTDEPKSIEEILVNTQLELPDVLVDLGMLLASDSIEEVHNA